MELMTVMGFAFTSCSNHDLYDQDAVNEKITGQKTEQFESKFIAKYGPIDPNQTWDFTSMMPTYSLPSTGASTRGITRAVSMTKDNMLIDQDVIQYLLDNLPKGNNNTTKGRPFTMVTTGNAFTIVPVFQGCASYYWELWMNVDGSDYLIWSKGSDDFKFRKAGTTDWSEPGTGKDGMKREYGALEVSAPTYTYNGIDAGKNMYFYLKTWKHKSTLTGYEVYQKYQDEPNVNAYKPVTSSSLDSWMIDLQDATKPTNLPTGNTVTIIGCEDETGSGTDSDFEDLVFMVYGNPVPPTKRIKEVIESKTKRYMLEDLGGSDISDFDYNDIVVDVSDRKKITYIYDSQEATEPSSTQEEAMPQHAIVRAVGGTLDFTLTIGTTTWTKSKCTNINDVKDMLNTGIDGPIQYDRVLDEFDVSGWDSKGNNVSVSVEGRGENEDNKVYTIKFPKEGDAPKIIAVDPSIKWMKERNSVPSNWFKQ